MNSRDKFVDTKLVDALSSTAINTDTVTNGIAIDISKDVALSFVLIVSGWTAGDVKIQDIQFADDSGFTTNVETFATDDFLLPNDRYNQDDSAVDQTLLASVGRKKLSLGNLALNSQTFARVRLLSANSADLVANVELIASEDKSPVAL